MAKARKKSVNVLTELSAGDPVGPEDSGDTTAPRLDRDRVAYRAYELYVARGGQHGHALEDWLEAEQELLQATRRTRHRE